MDSADKPKNLNFGQSFAQLEEAIPLVGKGLTNLEVATCAFDDSITSTFKLPSNKNHDDSCNYRRDVVKNR